MPDDKLQNLMLGRPVSVTGDVKYPEKGVSNLGDDLLRGIAVGTGIEDQQPGDAAGAIGATLGAVSMIPPGIAKLRGPMLIQKAKEAGMPEHILEALEMTQKRWPRLFGHTAEIVPVPDLSERMGGPAVGASSPSQSATDEMQRMHPGMKKRAGLVSGLYVDPAAIPNKNIAAQVVGHELLHGADALTNPDSTELYRFANTLPGGYHANSQEVRARLQGGLTEGYMKGYPRGVMSVETAPDRNETHIILRAGGTTKGPSKVDSRINSIPPKEGRSIPISDASGTPDPREKLYELMRERMERRRQGIVDPRVPKDK